jgi:putative peptidoglycan lipid II flippase
VAQYLAAEPTVAGTTGVRSERVWGRYSRVLGSSRGAVLGLTAIAIATKGIGFVRTVALAAQFGTSHAVAAFVVVLGVQAVVAIVLADAVGIGVASLVARGEASVGSALGFALGLAVLTAAVQAATAGIAAGPLTSEQPYLTGEVQRALLWTAVGSGGVVLMGGVGGVLIALRRLQLSAWLPAIAAFGALLVLVSVASPQLAIYGGWAVAMAAVPLAAAIALSGGLWKLIKAVRFNPKYLLAAAPIALATLASQGSFLIERRFAAPLGARAVASIGYAQQIAMVPLGIVIGSLGTWALHAFLQRSTEDGLGLRRVFIRTMAVTLLATAAMLIGFLLFADQVVALLLKRGRFSGHDVQTAASALRGFAIGLPAMGGYLMCVRAAQAQKRYLVIVLSALIGLLVTLVTVGRFTALWGEFGVLLATSVGNWASFALLAAAIDRTLGQRGASEPQLLEQQPEIVPRGSG